MGAAVMVFHPPFPVERDGAQVDALIDDLPLALGRPAFLSEVEGESGYRLAVRPQDRARPAGAYSQRQDEIAKALPMRIFRNVLGKHLGPEIERGPAGPDGRSDFNAADQIAKGRRKPRTRQRTEASIGISSHNGADYIRRQAINFTAKTIHRLG